MNTEFSKTMLLRIKNTVEGMGYCAKLVNQNCIFIYAYSNDNVASYVLTKSNDIPTNVNGVFKLRQFNANGTFTETDFEFNEFDSLFEKLVLKESL